MYEDIIFIIKTLEKQEEREMSKGNIGNIGKLLLTGVVGGAIALGGNAIYQNTQSTNTSTSSTGSTQVSKVNVSVNTDTTAAIKKVSNAVVSVLNYTSSSNSSSIDSLFGGNSNSSSNQPTLSSEGSGVIYKKDGNTAYVVTNYHVIAGNSSLEVLMAGGQKTKATVVSYDEVTDLAVLKIDAKYVNDVATFANSDNITVGEPAIAVGSPLGSTFANTATEGIVSAKSRQVSMQQENSTTYTNINAIQTDASINPGNSGGALINIEGQVIGITQSKLTTTQDGSTSVEGMGFAIPSNTVVTIIAQLEKGEKIVRPALGIGGAALTDLNSSLVSQLNLPSNVTSGFVLSTPQADWPAANAGLKMYDVITKLGGVDITSMADLQGALFQHSVGDTISVTYYRDGKEHTASIKLTKSTTDLDKLNQEAQNNANNSNNNSNNSNNIFGGN